MSANPRHSTHYYGDGCKPEHRAEQACEAFTTGGYAHAHDLGWIPCINCGWRFQEHAGAPLTSNQQKGT